jgi:lipopolysaccharide export system protein LptA
MALGATLAFTPLGRLLAQGTGSNSPGGGQAITLLSDVQQADSKTGIVTATGNVQIFYPARGITATAAQAQYFSRERRIVLTGNVYVYQEGGNSLRGEVVTYFVDDERIEAFPPNRQQVESVYTLQDSSSEESQDPPPSPKPEPAVPDLP